MLQIPISVKEQIIDQALQELPNEACGYLAGSGETVTAMIPMTNADQSPEHFSFIPAEQFKAVKEARAKGLDLIAVYHSHPQSPARLSAEDLRLANDPKMIYLVVSLMESEPILKAFRVVSKVSTEVLIQYTGSDD